MEVLKHSEPYKQNFKIDSKRHKAKFKAVTCAMCPFLLVFLKTLPAALCAMCLLRFKSLSMMRVHSTLPVLESAPTTIILVYNSINMYTMFSYNLAEWKRV